MIKAQRVKYALAVPVFVLATVVAQFANVSLVSAAPVTWDGGAADGLFSSAANWSNDTVPSNGDNLVFSASAIGSESLILNNDISNLSVSGISVSGTGTGYGVLAIGGNPFTLTGNISNTATYNGSPKTLDFNSGITLGANVSSTGAVDFYTVNVGSYTLSLSSPSNTCGVQTGLLSGTGTVNISGAGYMTPLSGSSTFSGSYNVTQGSFIVQSPTVIEDAAAINVSGSGTLLLGARSNNTYSTPITLGGSGRLVANQNTSGCSGSTPTEVFTSTLTGAVTLTSDFRFLGENSIAITGDYNANGHSFTVENGSNGSITTPQGTVEPQPFTTQLDGDEPNEWVDVYNKETAYLNGNRLTVSVLAGGTLKGTGTTEVLYNYGTVNPGNSPGKLNILEMYTENGTYQVEIQNKNSYDQLSVGAEAVNSSDGVFLTADAKLQVQLFGDWDIKAGDTFTIVDNLSANQVTGTYSGLAEGTQFTVDGVVFSISYVGGTGNDIVLTAINSVTAPNTGVLQVVKSNPAIVAVLGVVSAAAVLALALRRKSTR